MAFFTLSFSDGRSPSHLPVSDLRLLLLDSSGHAHIVAFSSWHRKVGSACRLSLSARHSCLVSSAAVRYRLTCPLRQRRASRKANREVWRLAPIRFIADSRFCFSYNGLLQGGFVHPTDSSGFGSDWWLYRRNAPFRCALNVLVYLRDFTMPVTFGILVWIARHSPFSVRRSFTAFFPPRSALVWLYPIWS